MKLNRLADAAHFTGHNSADALIQTHDVADQEIAAPEMILVFADHCSQQQALGKKSFVSLGKSLRHFLEHLNGFAPAQLQNDVVFAFGDHQRLADRPATLADDEIDLHIAEDADPDGAAVEYA